MSPEDPRRAWLETVAAMLRQDDPLGAAEAMQSLERAIRRADSPPDASFRARFDEVARAAEVKLRSLGRALDAEARSQQARKAYAAAGREDEP